MTILVTGGTGKTGLRLAHLLHQNNQPALLTSRSGTVPQPYAGVRFDWLDSSTYDAPFKADAHIDRAYLVAPPILDPLPPMKAFIELAASKGVKRFVLLSASILEKGGPAMGKVHEYLAGLGVDYCVLRPSWFFENFTLQYRSKLPDEDTIFSATDNGRVPWVAVDDIADVAFKALMDEKSHNTDHIIVGPELLSYDQAAELLTDVLGRKIKHKSVSEEELKKLLISTGITEDYAAMLSSTDRLIAAGAEEQTFSAVGKCSGQRNLREFIEVNKGIWMSNK